MTLPIPLSVRLMTDRADRHITADLHDLSFRSVIPGGFASARFTISRPLTRQPDEIAYYAKVYIYDARNGRTVWEGRLEDPGRSVGGDGELWELAAVGPSAHAQDSNAPKIWADRRLDGAWFVDEARSSINSRMEFVQDAAGNPVMRLSPVPINSDAVSGSWRAGFVYKAIRDTGQILARARVGVVAGWTNASWEVQIFSLNSSDVEFNVDTNSVSTTPASLTGTYDAAPTSNTGDIRGGDDVLAFLMDIPGGSAGISDTTWVMGLVHCIRSALHTKAGTLITAGYSADTVLASEIVADLLGTVLDQYDGANATVTTTTHTFDQVAYPDGAPPADIFRDLMALEPTFYWAAWESNTAGLHRFEWREWPTTVAYDASVDDGYSSTGSADGLYNKVQVRWRNQLGVPKTTADTQTVPELTSAGLTREAFLDLGDEIGSSANAERAAEQFLTDHMAAPNQGRLVISRPIYDHTLGRSVAPWEIRPGKLIRVRGILANSDALNASSRDGVTVFRVISVDFDASSASATLELDTQPLTLAHLLTRIKNIPAARWRERWR